MKIWAHRGCSYRYPENTISSFREACRYEITGIELDIQLSRDGELMVIHDETVDRTTDGHGRVVDMTLRELKQLKIRPNERSSRIHETIPAMREVLAFLAPICREDGLLVNIELKNSKIRYEGMEEKILELVAEYALEQYVVYSSFNPESLSLLKSLAPCVKTGVLNRSVRECLETAGRIQADAIHPFLKAGDLAFLSDLTKTLSVRAWNDRMYEPFFPEEREIEIQDTEKLEQVGITDIFTNTPESYVSLKKPKWKPIHLEAGLGVREDTGYIQSTEAGGWASRDFHHVMPGDVLHWKDGCWRYQVYRYSTQIQGELIHTYCYEPEQNWASYIREPRGWNNEDIAFTEECYIRIAAQPALEAGRAEVCVPEDLAVIEPAAARVHEWPVYFQAETLLTVETVQKLLRGCDLAFAVVTDTHYVNNGTWERSVYNLWQVAWRLPLDGIIHLGDLTDGMLPIDRTKESVERVMADMKRAGRPIYLCCGNHDSNYFRNNPEKMTEEEMAAYYLGREKPYYYVDYPVQRIRICYLYSFDYREKVRYGFPIEELDWLGETLEEMPAAYAALVCAHVPPLPEIHFWSDEIRNGEALLELLGGYHRSGKKILAYVHGHNHGEQIYSERPFPIISLGCNKMEDFQDKKPQGSWTCRRRQDTVTEDLWDVMVVHADHKSLDFVRFGAGEDKHVECGG